MAKTNTMFEKAAAVVVAAAGAGLLVTLLPGFALEPANGATQVVELTTETVVTAAPAAKPAEDIAPAAAPVTPSAGVECGQTWPYYEQSCLRGGQHADGAARPVRIIVAQRTVAAERPVAERTIVADRMHPARSKHTR